MDRWGLLIRGAGVGRRCWCPEGGNGVRGDTLELWSPGSPRQPAGAVGDPTSRDRTGSGPFPRLEAASDQQQCGYVPCSWKVEKLGWLDLLAGIWAVINLAGASSSSPLGVVSRQCSFANRHSTVTSVSEI